MYPWVWLWLPQIHYPLSGAVSQDIEPRAWFSSMVEPGAGDAEIERRAFAVASYGTQLGLLADVLIDIAEQTETLSPHAEQSLTQLRDIKSAVEKIKEAEYAARGLPRQPVEPMPTHVGSGLPEEMDVIVTRA